MIKNPGWEARLHKLGSFSSGVNKQFWDAPIGDPKTFLTSPAKKILTQAQLNVTSHMLWLFNKSMSPFVSWKFAYCKCAVQNWVSMLSFVDMSCLWKLGVDPHLLMKTILITSNAGTVVPYCIITGYANMVKHSHMTGLSLLCSLHGYTESSTKWQRRYVWPNKWQVDNCDSRTNCDTGYCSVVRLSWHRSMQTCWTSQAFLLIVHSMCTRRCVRLSYIIWFA